ncbi:MAG TPA: hydroxymethylbilane synthase [Thermomicrobiales bacterium]|nr:hydroxymethylbilane synthase [Thermomicrobiales bacterium]
MSGNCVSVSSEPKSFRVGTRGSALALWQAHAVQALLQKASREHAFELEIIRPEGDIDKHSSLMKIGGRGVFTSALQVQLLDGRVDLAVHSTKDLPSLAPNGVTIAAFPEREDARDALVSRHGVSLNELPRNPVIGTSSRRRAVQVLAIRPDAEIRELRGNIDTRLRKGLSEIYDAVILAAAGLRRMGWDDPITALMPVDQFVPAPGQGALAVETRIAPDPAQEIGARLDDADIRLAVGTERAFLRGVGGGCTTPIGAHARVERDRAIPVVRFWGMLASDDGRRLERVYEEFSLDDAETGAFAVANRLVRTVAPKWIGTDHLNPLAGVTVLVTGSEAQGQPLMDALTARGAQAVRMPTITIQPVADTSPVENAVERAVGGEIDWLVLTSAHAVEPLAVHLHGRDVAARIAVVGTRTQEALERAGLKAHLVAAGPGAEQLVREMVHVGVYGNKVVCLVSDKARPVLADGLRAAGADVEAIEAYRNVPVSEVDGEVRSLIHCGKIDAVTFASPSAIDGFRHLAGADLPALSGAAFFSIGPTTSAALRVAGLPMHGEAPTQDAEGFIHALQHYFGHAAAVSAPGVHV